MFSLEGTVLSLLLLDIIIVFSCFFFFFFSPIKYEKKALEVVGKRLKKNSVSLDVVNFGDDDDQDKPLKLEALLSSVNNNDGSHIVHVPSGPNALSDVLLRYFFLASTSLLHM